MDVSLYTHPRAVPDPLADLPFAGVPALSKALFRNTDPYQYFVPQLAHSSNPDDPIPLLTSTVLTRLMASSRDVSKATEKALPVLFSYLSTLAKSPDAGVQDMAVQEYSSLLYGKIPREQFWRQRSETVASLVEILQRAAGIAGDVSSASLWSGSTTLRGANFEGSLGAGVSLQLLYHVLLVVWQLSFEAEDIGDDLNEYASSPLPTSHKKSLTSSQRI